MAECGIVREIEVDSDFDGPIERRLLNTIFVDSGRNISLLKYTGDTPAQSVPQFQLHYKRNNDMNYYL